MPQSKIANKDRQQGSLARIASKQVLQAKQGSLSKDQLAIAIRHCFLQLASRVSSLQFESSFLSFPFFLPSSFLNQGVYQTTERLYLIQTESIGIERSERTSLFNSSSIGLVKQARQIATAIQASERDYREIEPRRTSFSILKTRTSSLSNNRSERPPTTGIGIINIYFQVQPESNFKAGNRLF